MYLIYMHIYTLFYFLVFHVYKLHVLVNSVCTLSSKFFLFDSLRPINNLSVKQGRVFLG